MDLAELELTSDKLHRMLLAFSERAKGQKFSKNASDQEMLEIVMSRYEKEIRHPIQNFIGGKLAEALLIQIQKLKLDIETAMLELDQILRANEINFAILAALPAFILSLLLIMLVRTWLKQLYLFRRQMTRLTKSFTAFCLFDVVVLVILYFFLTINIIICKMDRNCNDLCILYSLATYVRSFVYMYILVCVI
nr:protein DGS1, mitochondrial isoform X2 [Arachis hypogaea]